MPSQPKPESDNTSRDRLPFEPAKNRKKPEKTAATPSAPKASTAKPNSSPASRRGGSIPDEVSRRMVKRMALFCGIPTALGVSTFFVSYYVVVNGMFKLPTTAVLLVSLGFFGLGVLGLTYGALSASWDEGEAAGSWFGWREFTTNLGRMQQAWRDARNQSKGGA